MGILIPVFSLRRDCDLGIGDTLAMREAIDWAAEHHIGFLQLLPINETGSDNSPYNAISSVALDPVLISLDLIPGMSKTVIRSKAQQCEYAELVDYASVGALKWDLLEMGYRYFCQKSNDDTAFENFCQEEESWLISYTKYRWLMECAGTEEWSKWPEEYGTQAKAEVFIAKNSEAKERLRFYAWVQWHAFTQWRDLRQYAESKDVKLMGDIPIGVSYFSADVFFEPQWFDLTLSGGSPPEKVFKDDAFACQWGQNWGVPLYRWDELKKHDFVWWRRRIEKLTDVFHIFRIDHILGFYRIFSFPWRPERNAEFLGLTEEEAKRLTGGTLPKFHPHDDDTEAHKKANLDAGDQYIKVILEAAGAVEVVGEDLGCVPDYVRPHLAQLGIAGFKICQWESLEDGRALPGEEYPECAFATYATHDHEPLPALWNTLLQHLWGPEHQQAIESLALLSDFASMPICDSGHAYVKYGPVVKWSLLDGLLNCRANYAAVMINDLVDSAKRINIPGTVGGDNWRYRLPWSLKDMPEYLKRECQRMKALIDLSQRY